MYEIHSDYRNSRKVNYNRWSRYKEVDQLVEELLVDADQRERSLYFNNMKVLVLELYHSAHTDHRQYIAYHRNSTHYNNIRKLFRDKDNRYIHNPHISYDAFVGCVGLLHAEGYIVDSRGGNFYNEELGEYGFLSRMRATQKLYDLWRQYNIMPDMIGKFVEDEVIIQKDFPADKIVNKGTDKEKNIKVKRPFNYKNNSLTNRMRRVVRAYNKLLDHTHIDCDAACISDIDKAALIERFKEYDRTQNKEIRIKLLSKNVYRVFNNRSWVQGGRFYGAWWIGCPSTLRKYITLNGERTIELDYSGIHIQFLYAQKGINYAALKQDPYMLDDGLPDRDFNKLILLTAINAEKDSEACSSVFNQLRKQTGMLQKYNLTSHEPIKRKLQLLKEKHAPIADKIASGEGIKLQYLDSCVIEKLVIFATEHRIPVLTIHDSVVCPVKYADVIQDKMWLYYTELIQQKLSLAIGYKNSNPFTKRIIRMLATQATKYKPAPYVQHNPIIQNITINPNAVRAWLKPDDIIKIKTDVRENECSKDCHHSSRVVKYVNGERCYLGTIVVRMIDDAGVDRLELQG